MFNRGRSLSTRCESTYQFSENTGKTFEKLLYNFFLKNKFLSDVHAEPCQTSRSSHPEVFSEKGVLKIYSKFAGEHPCRSAISIKVQSNFIEITFRHECSPVNWLHIFRTSFLKNTYGRLLLSLFTYLENIRKPKFREFQRRKKENIVLTW